MASGKIEYFNIDFKETIPIEKTLWIPDQSTPISVNTSYAGTLKNSPEG